MVGDDGEIPEEVVVVGRPVLVKGLGFTGVTEGLAVLATVLLVFCGCCCVAGLGTVPHLTVTSPRGSERNHSERCFIRSVWR